MPTLTEQQKTVLRHYKSGLSRKETAKKMGLSVSTVSVHVFHAKTKLGLRNGAELFRWLFKNEV